jgi:hypothetical protein
LISSWLTNDELDLINSVNMRLNYIFALLGLAGATIAAPVAGM